MPCACVQFCFFAHSQEELRTPDTAPFLQEQEQAAAEAANRLTSVADRSSANGVSLYGTCNLSISL